MTRALLLSSAVGLLAAGCTVVELNTLVPALALSDVNTFPGNIRVCSTSAGARRTLAERQGLQLELIHSNVQKVQTALPPQLAGDPVVNSALQHALYISTYATVSARQLLNDGQLTETD